MRVSREVKTYVVFTALFFVVLEALLVVAVVWWPSFAANTGPLKSLSAPLPMLTEQINLIELYGVPAYVVGQHYFKACNTLGSAAAVLFAMGAIAGEAQRGTLELWLARPVTRLRLFTERYVAGQVMLFLPILLTSLTTPALLGTVDETMDYTHLVLCSVHQSLFLGVIYSLTFVLSALGSQPTKIALGMLFLVIFEFAIYMVKTITHYSVFRYADIETFAGILSTDALNWKTTAVMVGLNAVCFLVGYAIFRRRVP